MAGRPPDYDVCIVQEYQAGHGGEVKAKWYKVGVAWLNSKSGSISLSMVNLPGVKIMLVKPRASQAAGDGGQFGEPQYDDKGGF